MKTRHYKTLEGMMRACGIREINLNQMREGRIHHKTLGWINFTLDEDVKEDFYRGIAGVLWSRVTDERIEFVRYSDYKYILNRLAYNGQYKRYEYSAGQDYPGEIRFIQNLLRK
jgi:hypothetical protein